IQEKNVLQSDIERELAERDLLIEERNQERIEKNRVIDERNRIQSDNERALAERDRERIEKERFKQERDQEKRRADTTQSELDRQKTKTNESQELVRAFQQQVEATQSDNTRLTTEVQHLKAELSKLRPLTTSPKQQSKPEPKHQQIEQSVPPSLNPNMLIGIIPDEQYAQQQGIKIIHTDKYGESTVAFNPIISNGIVRFGGFFENHPVANFSIGIADSSAIFCSEEVPFSGENEKKTVCYWSRGKISHIGDQWIPGNSGIESNKSVSCEVNMNISPRTLTFFIDNQEQRLSVINIPSSIRFYIFLWQPNSSFKINRFENVQYSSAKGVSNGKVFEFGKEWKR
ncbi:MAG: hypothetical protein EZS28_042163, partial [Streblomastix strix]